MKLELLTGSGAPTALTDGVDCEIAAASIEALYAEVRRCHKVERGQPRGEGCAAQTSGHHDSAGGLDYQTCLTAFEGIA